MANIINHRGFIIEVYRDRGGEERYYMKARKREGTLLHSFDIDDCTMHFNEASAIEEAKQLIDNFVDTKPVQVTTSNHKLFIEEDYETSNEN